MKILLTLLTLLPLFLNAQTFECWHETSKGAKLNDIQIEKTTEAVILTQNNETLKVWTIEGKMYTSKNKTYYTFREKNDLIFKQLSKEIHEEWRIKDFYKRKRQSSI